MVIAKSQLLRASAAAVAISRGLNVNLARKCKWMVDRGSRELGCGTWEHDAELPVLETPVREP